MAPLVYLSFRKVSLFYLVMFVLLISMLLCASIESHAHELQSNRIGARRRLLELEAEEEEDQQLMIVKKKSSGSSLSANKNNQTKLIKSSSNQTKLIKSNLSTKNQTKLSKPTNSTKVTTLLSSTQLSKSELKKLNSTSQLIKKLNSTSLLKKKLNSTSKASDPSKLSSLTTTKTSDLLKLSQPKTNKTTTKKVSTTDLPHEPSSSSSSSKPQKTSKNPTTQKPKQQKKQPSWIDEDEDVDSDLVSEFRDLPTKFQQTLIPDLERISTTSKAYINRYNKQITKQFKPYVGNKHAPTIATLISCAFILIPLLLVSLVFNRIKAYFSLQKILIFIQVYLSIYFSILCVTSLLTGLEPLKFFYATSPSTYLCLQVLQTLGYVLYLLMLLMYLILVFSTESGLGSKMLGLAQTFVGFAVGLHYYVAVFHRVVLRQPPKTNWKVHGMYATCFLLISLCAKADRRKKAYLEEGGEEGKKN